MLTKKLTVYVRDHVARRHGLLGMWTAEGTTGALNLKTGAFEERRTDIAYGWNDEERKLDLVFEFKRLGKQKKHRDKYLGEQGLARFVTGLYSRGQPLAAMVGILLGPESDIIPPIRAALAKKPTADALRLRTTPTGSPFYEPATILPKATFETEHERDKQLAPPHGHIRVAHFFWAFGNDHPS